MKTSSHSVISGSVQQWLTAETAGLPESPSRKEAINKLLDQGLPAGKHEEYRFTPLTRALENQITSADSADRQQLTETQIPEIPGAVARIIISTDTCTLPAALPAGVQVSAIAEPTHRALTDAFALLNRCLNVHTVQITSDSTEDVVIHIHHDSARRVSAPALAVHVNNGAKLTVVETYAPQADTTFITHRLDAEVKSSGRFYWYALQDFNTNTSLVSNARIRVDKGAEATGFVVTSGGAIVRNNPVFEMAGSGSVSNLFGLYLLNGRTLADSHTVVDHQVPHADSNELYKGIMARQSRGVFNGKIYVRQDAQKTNAFQSNRNILLSDTATVNTKPQLEIWADDVKCSHGCTSGQLDEEALFYLRSRDIDRPSATALLLDAFAGEVVDKLPHEDLRNMIRNRVTARLAQLA